MADRKKVNNYSYVTTIVIEASRLRQLLWYFTNGLFFMSPLFPFSSMKVFLLRLFGAKIGRSVFVKPSVNVKYPWNLNIGNYVWIGEEVWIDNLSTISIGDNVCISQGALLLTGGHDHTKTSFDFISHPITLEEGVWIGARAVVGGGVTCKSHSILGINSVAESDLQEYTIYKGNPAVPVLRRFIN
jgi:putative colanic acid biosynthesis acetyltransferase WcaF